MCLVRRINLAQSINLHVEMNKAVACRADIFLWRKAAEKGLFESVNESDYVAVFG